MSVKMTTRDVNAEIAELERKITKLSKSRAQLRRVCIVGTWGLGFFIGLSGNALGPAAFQGVLLVVIAMMWGSE